MKYVSIDIETTGLDPHRHQIVEVGAVIDDLQSSVVDLLPTFRAVIVRDNYNISPYCITLHQKLFDLINTTEYDKHDLEAFGEHYLSHQPQRGEKAPNNHELLCTEEHFNYAFHTWLRQHGYTDRDKIIVAGKNFASFDKRFLDEIWTVKVHHRILDPMMLFTRIDDEKPPNLATCCERAGITLEDHHTAVGDALTVVKLLRMGLR